MIGETIIGNRTLPRQLFAPLIGGLLYQQIQGFVMALGIAPSDFKFVTGLLVLTAIGVRSLHYKDQENPSSNRL
jgi:putative ABC transport system permease protein